MITATTPVKRFLIYRWKVAYKRSVLIARGMQCHSKQGNCTVEDTYDVIERTHIAVTNIYCYREFNMASKHNNSTSHFLKTWWEWIWELKLALHRALSRHKGYFRNKLLVKENKTMTTWCVSASFRKAECLWFSDPFALKPDSLLNDIFIVFSNMGIYWLLSDGGFLRHAGCAEGLMGWTVLPTGKQHHADFILGLWARIM